MARALDHVRSHLHLYLLVGASTYAFLDYIKRSSIWGEARVVPSPRETVLPQLSKRQMEELPYPPDALPGARDVECPQGSVRVYEWGPADGEKVLLIHGISTPSIALGSVAHRLVEKGCRVMLFGTSMAVP